VRREACSPRLGFSALIFSALVLGGSLFPRSLPAAVCVGDCDSDRRVTAPELVLGVGIGLGRNDPSRCAALRSGCTAADVCIDALVEAVHNSIDRCPAPPPLPALVASQPPGDATGVPRTAWLRLDFGATVDPDSFEGLALACGTANIEVIATAIQENVVVVNPRGELPPGTACALSGPGGLDLPFETAARGAAAAVLHDRTDRRRTNPFPDDFWLTGDEKTATGKRVAVALPEGPDDLEQIFTALLEDANRLDGFSPIAHFVVELSEAPDPATLPATPADSLDPEATVGLFDLTPGSATFAARVPFRSELREDTSVGQVTSHSLLLFPSIPLAGGGRYGLVVTRRVLVDPERPLEASAFFQAALQAPVEGEAEEVTRTRRLAGEVLAALGSQAVPPIEADDVALALSISVRSTGAIPRDLLAIKEQVLAAAPPSFTIASVEPDDNANVAAIVSGTWQAPDWRDGLNLERDGDGLPVQTGSRAVPFTLALPAAALTGPVPLTMYQHGNPGSSEREVPSQARRTLAEAGFALIGFTDILNREVSPGATDQATAVAQQATAVVFALLDNRRDPDFWVETHAEQIAFLRMLSTLGALDVLPIGAPDGVPDIDVGLPLTYVGISEGANNAQAFLPFAPEIRAAAVVVGGARLGEVLIHQAAGLFISGLGALFPSLTPADIWVGVSLYQAIHDAQDPHNKAEFLYRNPIEVAGTTRKPSILVIEGLEDSLVPNHATDSLAWLMGPIPHLEPVQRPVPFLDTIAGPVRANIDAQTTAAFFQYVPTGVEGFPPTPGCAALNPSSGGEGHFCAQSAAESLRQRAAFFRSAVEDDVPTIINPFAE
jgi:hypothetical protein